MVLEIPAVLTQDELQRIRASLSGANWVDGSITAGSQSAKVKSNLQLPEGAAESRAARAVVLAALQRSALFFTAALPRTIFPPLFNRYEGKANAFGNHVDNAVRMIERTGERVRTDLSATLFLSEPQDYEGGQLVIEDTLGAHAVKLPAGHMILYPSSSVHRVEPVTRGARVASFFWIQSMVREAERRRLLFELDMSILALREAHGDTPQAVRLTACYHNLLRMWADA
jgi:PKHD-type hydroxylase